MAALAFAHPPPSFSSFTNQDGGEDMAKKTQAVTVKMSDRMERQLIACANAQDVSVSDLVRGLIQQHIRQQERAARLLAPLLDDHGNRGSRGAMGDD